MKVCLRFLPWASLSLEDGLCSSFSKTNKQTNKSRKTRRKQLFFEKYYERWNELETWSIQSELGRKIGLKKCMLEKH